MNITAVTEPKTYGLKPPHHGAIAKADGKGWYNDSRDSWTPIYDHLGNYIDGSELRLVPRIIGEREEIDLGVLDPYTCSVCSGTCISPIIAELNDENNHYIFSDEGVYFDSFFDCSTCGGTGRPPIPWKELM